MSADDLRLVSQRQACKLLGISRDRFVRPAPPHVAVDPVTGWKLYSVAGLRAWQERSAT